MKASELVRKLQAYIDDFGDQEVKYATWHADRSHMFVGYIKDDALKNIRDVSAEDRALDTGVIVIWDK